MSILLNEGRFSFLVNNFDNNSHGHNYLFCKSPEFDLKKISAARYIILVPQRRRKYLRLK